MKDKLMNEKSGIESLITNISHQLKTPLASLKMSYEILELDAFTDEEKKEFLLRGRDEVDKLTFLTETLTKISRLETGMIHLHKENKDFIETVKKAVGCIYQKAYKKGIKISLEISETFKIPHDIKWTEEAFVNVLDNAIKYSDSQTQITIRMNQLTTFILVEIIDEGIGVSSNEWNDIFKRFYRGKSKEVKETEGAGVGLYLTRYILEEQGGSIRIKPNLEKGSNFQMTLPK